MAVGPRAHLAVVSRAIFGISRAIFGISRAIFGISRAIFGIATPALASASQAGSVRTSPPGASGTSRVLHLRGTMPTFLGYFMYAAISLGAVFLLVTRIFLWA